MFVPVVHLFSMFWGSTVHENITLFILLLIDIWISFFPFYGGTVFNNAAMNIIVYVYWNTCAWISQGYVLGVELLGHRLCISLILLDNSRLFFKMFVPLNFSVQLFYLINLEKFYLALQIYLIIYSFAIFGYFNFP